MTGTPPYAPRWIAGFAAALACAVAGCKGTPVDVAKGRPLEPESNYVVSDYKSQEPQGLERFTPTNVAKSFRSAVGLGPDEQIARAHFDEGERLFAARQYNAAARQFKAAADRWPDSTLEEDAMFLRAEGYFFADRYSKSDDWYGELLKKYPNTKHLDKAVARQFSIARYWQQVDGSNHRWILVPNLVDKTQPLFDTGGHAINAFDSVRVNDPRGPLADDAIMAVAGTYFAKARYEDADYYYGLLRSEYPKSEYQLKAHQLGLQCKLLKYQGPGYNGKPLEEAEELIDQMLVQFSQELGDERERIVKAKAEVRAQRATRDMQLAQYWEKGSHYGAAKIYYAQIMKDFPQTPFAETAQTRLAAIQQEPDHPPNRMAFLTDWLEPEDDIVPNEDATITASREDDAQRR